MSARSGTWHLATEWTGSFPLYYVVVDGGLLFSSRLRPLARIAGASLDLVGILEVLERYSTLAGRTHFEEIRRLLPGQILRYEPGSGRLSVRETSALWAGDRGEAGDGGDAVEQAWVALSCQDGATTWICLTRNTAIALFKNWVFGAVALGTAALHLVRPSLVLFAIAMVAAAFGIVLYNIGASGLAAALLILSFARPASATK